MSAPVRLLAMVFLLVPSAPAGARPEVVYVAIGGSYPFAGAPRPEDPERIAAQLRRSGKPVRLVDFTVEGATVRDVRASQLRRTIALKPDLVTVGVGSADAAGGVPLASFARDLHVVTDLLHRTGATVVISTLPPAERLRDAPSPRFRRRVESFDWVIRRTARRNAARLAPIGGRDSGLEKSWGDAVAAAIGLSPPSPDRAPVGPAPERGVDVRAAPTPPTSDAGGGARDAVIAAADAR